jgi:hypothetical protein
VQHDLGVNWLNLKFAQQLEGPWTVEFDPASGGPQQPQIFDQLVDWSDQPNPKVRYYSGSATYTQTFSMSGSEARQFKVWLDVGRVENLAAVTVNGVECGTAWTAPYRVEITPALKPGDNELRIEGANTWHNKLVQEASLPEDERSTWMNAPNRLKGKPLLPAGLLGPVTVLVEQP